MARRCRRRALLQHRRYDPRHRALEERRHRRAAPCSSRTSAPAPATLVDPHALADVGRHALLHGRRRRHGYELWKSDGTAAGTVLVKDIVPGPTAPIPQSLTDVERHALLRGQRRHERRTSSGRATARPPAPCWSRTSVPARLGSDLADLTDVERHALLRGQRRHDGHELWKSDGTAAGTVLVKDISPGIQRRLRGPLARRRRAARSSSRPTTASTAHELWKSDGTAAGTVLVKDIRPAAGQLGDRRTILTERQRHALLRRQRRHARATSSGRATAPPPAPCWSRTSNPARQLGPHSSRRERHALLRRQRRRPRPRALEERRHSRRHRAREGHSARAVRHARSDLTPRSRCGRDALLRRQ